MKFDRGVAIGLFMLSLWVAYISLNITKAAFRQVVGPEVVPLGIAGGLMVASVLLFRSTLQPQPATSSSDEVPQRPVELLPEQSVSEDRVTQGLVILGIAAYIVVLEPLGYVVSTALLVTYEAAVFESKYWVRNIASGVLFSVAVYTLFVRFLEVLLPVGILGW